MNDHVAVGQRELISLTCLVKVSANNVIPNLVVLLLLRSDISEPSQIFNRLS